MRTLSVKKSVITQHVNSAKHATGLKRIVSKEIREKSIADLLKKYDDEAHPSGENLAESTRIYRVKVVTAFLKAGVPLNKVDCFREDLEESSYRLTASQNLSEMIQFIRNVEREKLQKKIEGKKLSVIFDGTTHVCEAMVIVLHFIDEHWCIKQRTARLMLLACSMTGEELARQLIVCLSTELGINGDHLIATMRDRAAINNVAIQTLQIIYPHILDIGCFSHTLDHVGEKMYTPVLDKFAKVWIGMFSRSPKSKLAWRTKTNLPVPTYSATRWWSKWEVLKQMHDSFGDIHPFLQDHSLPPSRLQLLEILDDPGNYCKLHMELVITIDAGEPFVKDTYRLEGDGPLALKAYEEICLLRSTISNEHYPNVLAVANEVAGGVPSHKNQLIAYAKACVKPAFDYFNCKFGTDLEKAVSAFKYARFFDPVKIVEIKPSASDIGRLRIFPFLDSDSIIDGLKVELPKYLATAEDISPEIDRLEWWKKHECDLPYWSQACKNVLLMQPSAAAAERVFSILSSSFTERQTSSLEDYIETSVLY